MTNFKLHALAATLALVSLSSVPVVLQAQVSTANSADWAGTVSAVADSVVAINLSRLRAYDDDEQTSTTATGFVVDAEQGLLLTNRHVIGAGPVRATATFQNQERASLRKCCARSRPGSLKITVAIAWVATPLWGQLIEANLT
ncbi:MAG: hypothetical protein ACPGSC_15185 [Granulosicoccaceae bacterium]